MRISDWSSDVCSSDLDEQRVPGEHSDRAIGIGRVVQHKGKVIVRVSRSFKHPDFQLAYRELIAFARGLGIDHFAAGIGAVQHARTGHGRTDVGTRYQLLISLSLDRKSSG